jgi:ribonuclease P protein component
MSLKGREAFPKSARLRKRSEFLKLSRNGRKIQSANFVIISKPNDRTETRIGITVSGKVGNSAVRNHVKRLVREFFRRRRPQLPQGSDYLVIARTSAADISAKIVADELGKALNQPRNQRNDD